MHPRSVMFASDLRLGLDTVMPHDIQARGDRECLRCGGPQFETTRGSQESLNRFGQTNPV